MPVLSTCLPLEAARGLDLIERNARTLGLDVRRADQQAEIQLGFGALQARPEAAGLRLEISAEDASGLDRIRSVLDRMFAAEGLAAQGWQSPPATAAKSRLIGAEFVSARQISPSYVRVRLRGDFAVFAAGGLHFRLLLGPEGAAAPRSTPESSIDWPGGIDVWHRPPYTVRVISPDADWLDFDVFLHDGGRVTEWVASVRPGEAVMLTGPGGRGVRQAGWIGLVGDETALPVILRALEVAGPDTRGHAMIMVPDLADAQPLGLPPGLRLDWVPRGAGQEPITLFRSLTPPDSDRFLFFAGERQQAEAAREHAKAIGLAAGEFHAVSYWTAGWVPPSGQRQARGRS